MPKPIKHFFMQQTVRRGCQFSMLVLAFLSLWGCQPGSVQTHKNNSEISSTQSLPNEYSAQIDKIFTAYNDINTPGAAIAVVKDGEILFKKGYGSANLEYDIPVKSDTIFHVASVSKQFTVFAVLLLAEQGKLSFDDDIRKYIPEVPDFGETITLRHLASHTSGMRDQWNLLTMAGWRFDDVITKEHVMKLVEKQQELNFKPGAEYLYSNTGFTLLAEVVARVSGKTFAEFTQEAIFSPLGMINTLFYDDHQKIVKNRAYSYSPTETGFQKSVLSYANVGATSLFTTVEDISLWAMNFSDLKIGSKAIIDQMNTLAVLNSGETFGGAYGQFVSNYNGIEYIQHGGADAGYRTFFARFPEQGLAISAFNNSAAANPRTLTLEVAGLFLRDEIAAITPEAPASGQQELEFISLSEAALSQFTGHYWNDVDSYSREMYVKDGVLMYSRGGDNVSPLAPIAPNTFKMMEVDVELFVQFSTEPEKTMLVTEGSDVPSLFKAYEPFEATKERLTEYAGTYFSEELSTSYLLTPDDERLIVSHSRHSDMSITPIKQDIFTSEVWGLRHVRFERDENNMLTGMRVSNGRVRNLYFAKQ